MRFICSHYTPANISTLDQSSNNVDPKETKSDIGFVTLHNVDTTSVSDAETTLVGLYLDVASMWPQH